MNTIYSIVCVRDGIETEIFTGSIDELSQMFSNTISHGKSVQKEYMKRKIAKKIPSNIHKFIAYLNDCTYNVTSSENKIFKLK